MRYFFISRLIACYAEIYNSPSNCTLQLGKVVLVKEPEIHFLGRTKARVLVL